MTEDRAEAVAEDLIHDRAGIRAVKKSRPAVVMDEIGDEFERDMPAAVKVVTGDEPAPMVQALHLIEEEVPQPIRDEPPMVKLNSHGAMGGG